MSILEHAKKRILVLDGAMGTQIHALGLPEEAWDGNLGCSEYLNLVAPEKIRSIHENYLAAGADIVETNTFGGSANTLAEYDLQARTEEINRIAASLARAAADAHATPDRPRFVAGSIGPGTKLATLGQTTYDDLYEGHRRQIEGLLDGGVDLLLIETCQDLLQVKAALAAARDAMAHGRSVPIYVSVTIEQTGTLLTGTDMPGCVTVLSAFDVDVLGMNCATGPLAMRPHLEVLSQRWPGLVGVYPNAGIPMPSAEGVRFPEQPAEFSQSLRRFVGEMRIHFVGGCCGTTPDHIRALAGAVAGVTPLDRPVERIEAIGSLFSSVDIRQEPAPLFFGERANATGSKAFRDAMLAGRHDAAFEILAEQEEHGSHAADLSVAYAGQDERHHMDVMVARAARECRLPIMIDTNYADVAELALKRYAGRAVINSINLEDGGTRADLVGPMARRHGAALVCLTIDEEGMAMTAERKVAIAKRLALRCVNDYGLRAPDLFIDPLTFTVGSGDPSLKTSAMETMTAIRRIKAEIPGVWTLLGLSNVSFGLAMKGRRVLNSVFLDECLKAGLDAAILNPKHIVPLAELDAADINAALDVIHNRGDEPLEAFIRHFESRADFESDDAARLLSPTEAVHEGIVKGKSTLVEPNLDMLLGQMSAEAILNDILVPAMKHVGDLFGAGKLQLPFVLKSAEAMKRAVDRIKPHFSAEDPAGAAKTLVIATVRGDVHDIGKNLVDIIVSNNGFRVVNLGTKVPVQRIMDEARAHGADVVGMSGLLVSSAMLMIDNLKAMSDAGFTTPVLVGGAALTPEFVRDSLKPAYTTGTVSYCADAFAGLVAMQHVAEGKTPPDPVIEDEAPRPLAPVAPAVIERVTPPTPPFWGARIVDDVKIEALWSYLNEVALFRGRWGYRRGEMGANEYRDLIEKTVRPKYREFQRVIKAERLFTPRIAYGWFAARPDGDALVLTHEGREVRLDFPRQTSGAGLCIADFFHPDGDAAGLFVVTIGEEAEHRAKAVFERDAFADYYLFHGLATEATDALAEYAHEMMRHDLGIGESARLGWQDLVTQKYAGGRYGFGYPACPDLSANAALIELLGASRIGVLVTESFQMVPEFSTSAIVCHHPRAKYFAV